MADHAAIPTSTQERNPRSAVLRTVLAATIGLFPLLNGVLAAVKGALEPYAVELPGWVFLVLNGTILAATILTALVTRVLAVPGVNEWLRKYQILRWFTPQDNGK
ncbi:membrane protein [Arthrobacter phage Gusanita]|nr:membrane protein [Arthrobacter phage Gusanita]